MRRPETTESPQKYLLDVVDRDSLDEDHQALHPKQWMTIDPAGAVQYFDTEDEACKAQADAGPAYSDVPEDIQVDLAKVFSRLEVLGYKSFSLTYQETGADMTCSISLSEQETVGPDSADPKDWNKFDKLEIPELQGESGVMTLAEAVYALGERIGNHVVPGSDNWKDGRLVHLSGLLGAGVAGVRVELLQPVEKDVYRPFVLESESEDLQGKVRCLAEALRGAGVDSLRASYDGGGDQGDIEDFDLFDAQGDSLGDDVEEAVCNALEVDSLNEALWPVLLDFAGAWEDNNGSHGEMIVNASGSVSIDHYDREDGLDSIKVVNWRVDTVGAPQVQLDSAPEI